MRVLITNDDGIEAEGLRLLEEAAAAQGWEVWVCAPARERSGVSHAVTVTEALRPHQRAPRRVALEGAPADCVAWALRRAGAPKFDLVLSGVNAGGNLAEDAFYSGTVGAALEAAFQRVPAIALSQAFPPDWRERPDPFAAARLWTAKALERLAPLAKDPAIVLNVNFPPVAPEAISGFAVARQTIRPYNSLHLVERTDARGFPYAWLGFRHQPFEAEPGGDIAAIRAGKICVTPLGLDLTHHAALAPLTEALAKG